MTRQAAANETRPALSAVVILRSPRTVIIHALSGAEVEVAAGIAGRVTHGNRGSDCCVSPAFNRGAAREHRLHLRLATFIRMGQLGQTWLRPGAYSLPLRGHIDR